MILCIEDSSADSMTLFGIMRIATRRALIFVASPHDALRVIDALAKPPALVLCDLIMEGNGTSVIRTLRQRYPDVPIVVVTGSDDRTAEARARGDGAAAVLSKAPGLSIALHECLVTFGVEPPR